MKIGLIGCGVMANAIIGGIIQSGLCQPHDIIGSDPSEKSRQRTEEAHGVITSEDNRRVLKEADFVFLAVKPQYYTDMIAGIRDHVRPDQVLISIGAGRTLTYLDEQFGRPVKLVRVMPNTPARVGEAMSAVCPGPCVSAEETDQVLAIIRTFGKAELMPERLFDIVTGVSGSGPAYVFLFIEALADAAVEGGMPRNQAYTFAAQTVLGSAKMALETGLHPGILKDMVTSPAGTTIAGVRALEKEGLRYAAMEAVRAATDRSAQLQKAD